MKKIILILLLCPIGSNLYAQPLNEPKDSLEVQSQVENTEKFTNKQKWIIGGLVAQQAASMYLEYKWWWQGDYHPFVIRSDGGFDKNSYSLGIDKTGHFYTSYMYSNLLYELLKYGEFNEKNCIILRTVLPFVWALSIELGDGFSSYEFSPQDLLANSLGIGYAFAQRKIPYLNHFKFKYSYFPGQYYRDNNFKAWSLTADYDGHIYWLATDVHGVLPDKAKRFWPKYLNLAFGYGINNYSNINFNKYQGYELQREFFIGLDYNLSAIPAKKPALKTIRNMADYYHFPAPGIKKTGTSNWEFKPLILN